MDVMNGTDWQPKDRSKIPYLRIHLDVGSIVLGLSRYFSGTGKQIIREPRNKTTREISRMLLPGHQ